MTFAPRDGLDWTREEVVFALGLYFLIPWGKINQRNPVVIQAAQLLGRTPGSLGRKMGNLGRFDPANCPLVCGHNVLYTLIDFL